MYKLSTSSKDKLYTCDYRIQLIVNAIRNLALIDITISEGVRSKELQDKYYKEKKSKVRWPNGKHNITESDQKSKAVDIAPCINGEVSYDPRHCCFLAGQILAIAKALGFKLRWGGNWDMDGEPITDQDFQDLVHFELVY
jgi:peptidoglycan L-alanyl-D-glutamate endopeptidase CwlK